MLPLCPADLKPDQDFRTMFDGRRLPGNYTPAQLGMEDGDVIDLFPEQAGC